jgi:hypothetical protein
MDRVKIMRGAPGKSQIKIVAYLFDQGYSIEEVSDRLCIEVEGLKPYAPKDAKKKSDTDTLAEMIGDEKPAPVKKAVKKKVVKKKVTSNAKSD